MEVMVFDVPMLATKMTWLMMESISHPWHWILMKICLVVFCIFNNSVNIKPSHPLIQTEWSAVICSRAGWYQLTEAIIFEMWQVCFFLLVLFVFCSCSSLVFLLWWVNTRSTWSLSSDITCQSRQEQCSLKVTLLWCLYSACHYVFHFLWA